MCLAVCLWTFSNLNISATSGPIVTKFYLNHHWGGGKAALEGELIVYQSSRRLSVCLAVCQHFQTRIPPQPVGNCNKILSEPSLGSGKGCIRFWARSDRNSGVHGNG